MVKMKSVKLSSYSETEKIINIHIYEEYSSKLLLKSLHPTSRMLGYKVSLVIAV